MNRITSILQAWQQSNLMLRILAGIVVGSVLALSVPGISAVSMLGDLFVGALKAIAPVLVAVLVTSSVATARAGLGNRFRTIIALYMLTTFDTASAHWRRQLTVCSLATAFSANPKITAQKRILR